MKIEEIKALLVESVHQGGSDLIASAVCEWANCQDSSIDENGNIWIENPCSGHYISDDKIAEFWVWCKAQES